VPYIRPEDRAKLLPLEFSAAGMSAGELNYLMTRLVLSWIGEPSYSKIATATGVVENVKQELYRRLASPYEDAKIAENGDVY